MSSSRPWTLANRRAQVNALEAHAPRAALHLGNAQDRREHRQQVVGLGFRLAHRREDRRGLLAPFDQGKLVAQPRERRPQLMGNGVGDVPHFAHELVDPVEHAIERLGLLVETVARAGDGHALLEVAVDDGVNGAAHLDDPARDGRAEDDEAADHDHDDRAEAENVDARAGREIIVDRLGLADHRQAQPVADLPDEGAAMGEALDLVVVAQARIAERQRAQHGDVAGDLMARPVLQHHAQIRRIAVARLGGDAVRDARGDGGLVASAQLQAFGGDALVDELRHRRRIGEIGGEAGADGRDQEERHEQDGEAPERSQRRPFHARSM